MTETLSPGANVPALEKGMDVLEFLALQDKPVSLQDISTALHKSRGELYRMVKWLVDRQYIVRIEANDTYLLGERIGGFYRSQPASENIIAKALPLMEELSAKFEATSYLTARAHLSGVVLFATQSNGHYNLTIQVGTHLSLTNHPSGACFATHFTDAQKMELQNMIEPENLSKFQSECNSFAQNRFVARFGTWAPGYFELSFLGPTKDKLVSAITLVKVVRSETDAEVLTDAISGVLNSADNF